LAAAAAAAASSKKRVESPPQPIPAASFLGFKQTDLNQLASGSEALRNQFFEALMSPPAATKVLPNNNEESEPPQAPVVLQQQLSLLKEKQANNAALRVQEEARRELEDARKAVAQAFDAANDLGEFAPKPVVPIAPQSPIPSGPVADKVAEAFGAAPAESAARKESRDLYGTPSSNYKFLDLPPKADVNVDSYEGGRFGKMPPPPAGLYPVTIRLLSTLIQPSSTTVGPKPAAFETFPKPSATAMYGFSPMVVSFPQQDVSKKEKELITSSMPPSSIGSSPPKASSANISNTLHPMPSPLPTVTWDAHGIQSKEFLEAAGSFQQHEKRDGIEGAVPVKKHVSGVLSNLSALPNLYPINSVLSQQHKQNQQPPPPQSRLNLPSAVVMMGKPRPISSTSSTSSYLTPPMAQLTAGGPFESGNAASLAVYSTSVGGSMLSVMSDSNFSQMISLGGGTHLKDNPIPSLDAARKSPRFAFSSSASGFHLTRDAYQAYDKEAQYKKRGSTSLPISFSAATAAAGKRDDSRDHNLNYP